MASSCRDLWEELGANAKNYGRQLRAWVSRLATPPARDELRQSPAFKTPARPNRRYSGRAGAQGCLLLVTH